MSQTWTPASGGLKVKIWLDDGRRYVTHLISGWPAGLTRKRTGKPPTDLALAEVYAIAVTGEIHLPRGPELARWKRRALAGAGILQPAPVRLKALPPGAPDSAESTWKAIEHLLAIRWLTDPQEDPVVLSAPFLARWTGVDEQTLRRGKYWLSKQGFITKAGTVPSAGGGRPTQLWTVSLESDPSGSYNPRNGGNT
jgi:hypothetical protein